MKYLCSISIPATLIFLVPMAAGQDLYSLIDLGILHEDGFSQARAINDLGQVVGDSRDADSMSVPFLWDSTTMTMQPLPTSDRGGTAYDINNRGDIVGFTDAEEPLLLHGALWRNGERVELGDNFRPHAINDAGQIVGISIREVLPLSWVEETGTNSLPDLPGGPVRGGAQDINGDGLIVGFSNASNGFTGQRAVIWNDDGADSISGLNGSASSINDRGQIVANLTSEPFSNNQRAFIYDVATEVMTDVGELAGGRDRSRAEAINNEGVVVGSSSTATVDGSPINHAFVWDETNGIRDLNSLLDDTGIGWELLVAEDINASGQIVGYAANPDGEWRGFLLNPVPEPSSSTLVFVAATVIASTLRRTKRLTDST